MLLRILSRTGTLEKLKGSVHTGRFGREFHWGRKTDPCILYFNDTNQPPEKLIPGGTQLDIAHIRIANRNRLYVEKHDESKNPQHDLFLAVHLLLPHDFKGVRAIEVASLRDATWQSERLYCDTCQLVKVGLAKRPMLSLHSYVLVKRGEVARLIHQLPSAAKAGCWYILYNKETPEVLYYEDYVLAPPPPDML